MKNYIDKLEELKNEAIKLNKKEAEAREKYFDNVINHEEMAKLIEDVEQKRYFLDIQKGILKNNIFKKILDIYNEEIKPYIIEKYNNKNIGEKREKEISQHFEERLKKESVSSYIHFKLNRDAYCTYKGGAISGTIYKDEEAKAQYYTGFGFEIVFDTWQNGLNNLYYNDLQETPIDEIEEKAKILLNNKIEAVRRIKEKQQEIENIIEQYNKENESEIKKENFENLHINYIKGELKEYSIERMQKI